jgi:hypothetical protein
MATLDAADAERFNWTVFASVEPEFAVLRTAPAFSALVARVHVGGWSTSPNH